ncbi:hypothetical protein HOY80DRAFT_954874 [Tuber brumale]|nr:hypothetical protein HOY80DRAFT_954874 [Tuber brumale]
MYDSLVFVLLFITTMTRAVAISPPPCSSSTLSLQYPFFPFSFPSPLFLSFSDFTSSHAFLPLQYSFSNSNRI